MNFSLSIIGYDAPPSYLTSRVKIEIYVYVRKKLECRSSILVSSLFFVFAARLHLVFHCPSFLACRAGMDLYGGLPKAKEGPKDLLEMLSEPPKNPNMPARLVERKGPAMGGFIMPPPKVINRGPAKPGVKPGAKPGAKPAGAMAGMMPPSVALGKRPAQGSATTVSLSRAPLSALQTVSVNKKSDHDSALEAAAAAGERGPAAPTTAGIEDDDDPYDPRRPNDFMAFCRERFVL